VSTPYQPFQVIRLLPVMEASGGMSLTWNQVTDVVDVVLDQPGLMACRLAIGYLRPGKDQLPPIVAGRPQDRFGVIYYDPVTDSSGVPLVKAGDRFLCIAGPISGTFEMRNPPDQMQSYRGAAHCEAQVVEVAAQSGPGSPTPFPGGAP
jgi:hypothetical protein